MYMFLPFATAAGAETETAGFFQKIWASLVNWFIDERGWVRLLVVLAVILVGLILIKIVLAVTR